MNPDSHWENAATVTSVYKTVLQWEQWASGPVEPRSQGEQAQPIISLWSVARGLEQVLGISVQIRPRRTRGRYPREKDADATGTLPFVLPTWMPDTQILLNLALELTVDYLHNSFSTQSCRGWHWNLILEKVFRCPQHVGIRGQDKGHKGLLHRHLDQVSATYIWNQV